MRPGSLATVNRKIDQKSKSYGAFMRNNYLDSLYIVSLETYLQRINAHNDPIPYPVEYQLKTYQCDYNPDTIPGIYQSIVTDTNIATFIIARRTEQLSSGGQHLLHSAP